MERYLRSRRSGKYVRKDHPFAAPIIARLDTLRDRCIAAPGLLAAVIVGKYCDHLPLYRQEEIFATRHDVHIPRQRVTRQRLPIYRGAQIA